MLDILRIRTNPDVVWSGSCQTTGSRKHLDVTHPKSAQKTSKRKYSGHNNGKSAKQPITAVFSGSIVAPAAYERLENTNSKRVNFRFGNRSTAVNGTTSRSIPTPQVQKNCFNGVFNTAKQKQQENPVSSHNLATSTQQTRTITSLPNTPRRSSLARTQPKVEISSLPTTTVSIQSVANLLNKQKTNTSDNESNGNKLQQRWRKAFHSVLNDPENSDSQSGNDTMFSHTISLPKKFTHQEIVARIVTAMKNPTPKSPLDAPPTSGASLSSDQKFFPHAGERAQSASMLERGAMRKEIQRRLSSEAWYQKALGSLREIPAYVSRADEEHSHDLEEIAKRLCRTTAASRAREAATNKVVYREPELRDELSGHVQKPRPKSSTVISAMINSMHRFKGQKQKRGPDVEETVKRLSAYEAEKIPDRRRIVPPENLRQMGIMNTLSWKGQDPFQKEGVNMAGLEAIVLNLSGK